MIICEGCSTQHEKNVHFCTHCGRVLPEDRSTYHVQKDGFFEFETMDGLFGGSLGRSKSEQPASDTSENFANNPKHEQPSTPPLKPNNKPSKINMVGVITKSVIRSLLLTLVVLGPGFYMLMTGMTVPGMAWMFVGSFGLMAWTYRKPWRLGVVSCVLPPLIAGFSYTLQLVLFGDAAPQDVVIIAIGIGLLVGYLRARTHNVMQDETGSIVAQRTYGYLLIWVIAYGVTQSFGYFSRESLAVRAGLVTGAFSTAMLAMVSIVIWSQYRKAKTLLPIIVICLMTFFAIDNPAHADERTLTKLKSIAGTSMNHESLPQNIRESVPPGLTLSERKGSKMTINSNIHGAQYEFIFDSTSRQISPTVLGIMLLESDSASLDYFVKNQMPTNNVERGNYCNGPSLRFSGDDGTTQEILMKSNQYLLIVRATTELFPKNRQAKPQTLKNMARAGCIYFADRLAMTSTQSPQPSQTAPAPPPPTSTNNDFQPDPSVPPTSESEKEEIAAVTATVAAALVAAGIAVNIAQAVAAALAQAIQAGVQLTQEDLQDAIARARTHPRQQTGAREVDGDNAPPNVQTTERVTPPRPIYFDNDNPFETNDKGEYFAPDADGNWDWRSAEEAQRFEDEWRANDARVNAQRRAEIDEHERATREDMRRSRQSMHERDEQERQQSARTRQTKEELESIRTSASRNEADEILNRATSENIYNSDGSLNAEYLRRLKQALHNRLSREAATSDPNFKDNSWGRILGETATTTLETADKTLEEASNNLKIRIISGMLSGGSSEAIFQGHQVLNAVKSAAENAEDAGKILSRSDAIRIVAGKFKDTNLPVNTYNALEAARKSGKEITWSELVTTLTADGFSLLDAGEVMGVTNGQAIESIARRILSEETFKQAANAIRNGNVKINSKIGELGQHIDNAHTKIMGSMEGTKLGAGLNKLRSGLEKIGLEPRRAGLTVHQAGAFKNSGKLRVDTENLIDATRKNPSSITSNLDEAFELGRKRGRAKVEEFQSAVDSLNTLKNTPNVPNADIELMKRKVRNKLVEVQADKHAMNELNALNKGNGHSTIDEFNREMSNIHQEADRRTINRLAEHRGRDLTNPTGTAKTIQDKVEHWMNETDRLKKMAKRTSDPTQAQQLYSQASAHMEDAQRQLFEQYGNMGIKRLGAIQSAMNARGTRIPRELAERMNVLGRVFKGDPKLSPAAAEEVLRKMGTNTRDLSRQLSVLVEGYEQLRPPPLKPPTIVFQGWQDEFKHEDT